MGIRDGSNDTRVDSPLLRLYNILLETFFYALLCLGQLCIWPPRQVSSTSSTIWVTLLLISEAFKGTMSRDFLLQVFYVSSSPKPLKISFGSLQIFSKNRGDIQIFTRQGAFTGINDIGSKFCHRYCWCCWYQWQIMGTISDCWHFTVNLKGKNIYMLTLLPKV